MNRSPISAAKTLPLASNARQPATGTLSNGRLFLALGALGVVYGDIGTSPLYAIKECFHGTHAIALSENSIFGVLSLVFWSLTVVVSIKYVVFILKADDRGEGGIFALLALTLLDKKLLSPRLNAIVFLSAIFGAALLYGDGVITPAISVLSAVEGLEVATRTAQPLVLPITCVILLLLFLVQRRGTADIGTIFGPVMLIWFGVIAALGIKEIIANPRIALALSPSYAYDFFVVNRLHGIVVLGSVVFCITGGEALYADLGHFGRSAIRLSWLGIAFPTLLLKYFGQGALLLSHPDLASNPFYGLVPRYLLYPMVGLLTVATVIASQAMISGVFSLTQQAVQLGYCPRVQIVHTSSETEGQIYIPSVNDERSKIEDLGQGFYRFMAMYGFMEKPDVPEVLKLASQPGIEIDPATTTYFLGRETLFTSGDSKMMRWRKTLFAFMSRNAQTATVFFGIPVDRVIEIGIQIKL